MRIIEKLEPSRHVPGRVLVWLEGEKDPLRVTENEVLSFSLYAGRALEEETYQALVSAGGLSGAKARGAKMLGARPLSKQELKRRLQQKGESEGDASLAADWLEDIGALNDPEYARAIVRHYTTRGYGSRKLRFELQRRGVPKELWDEALEEQDDPVDRVVRFLDSRLKGEKPDEKQLKRVTDALLRRGFGWGEVQSGLRRYGAEVEEDFL